jgi:hypothetical protein
VKSDVSDFLELVQAIYLDACARCSADVSDLRDLKTIKSRVEGQGISFLTITLPNFCKDFERSLANGYVDPTFFQFFRKNGAIPAFLQGLLGQIFDHETGRILDETYDTPTYVDSVRQICLSFKKVEIPCTPEREYKAIVNFTEVEQANKNFELSEGDRQEFLDVSFVLWNRMLRDIRVDMLVPRHGPGATAERVSGNQKYVWRYWHERLEPYFPFLDNAYSLGVIDYKEFEKVTFVAEQDELPVRVTLVPKTLKAPRIIAIEPACMQYTQQAIQALLYEKIESFALTKGHVNFVDQSVNQEHAVIGSKTGQLVTIDLSDASDRVLHDLALHMFDSNPDLRDAINACRSTRARLPDGRIIDPLYKFASMGSALCFPVEAMNFYTICVAALLKKHNLPVTYGNIFYVTRGLYVYGDDLIVPTYAADTVLDYLNKFNCKVNTSKTFLTGRFRESCGVDAYAGIQVTPVYLRQKRPRNRRTVTEVVSWIATANLFYKKGYWKTASYMFNVCEAILGSLPYVSPESSVLGRVSFLGYQTAHRWSDRYQTLEVRGWSVREGRVRDPIDGHPALQKCLLSLERRSRGYADASDWGRRHSISTIVSDKSHLKRSVRRGSVALKRRWSTLL